jgi:hypothetical protein
MRRMWPRALLNLATVVVAVALASATPARAGHTRFSFGFTFGFPAYAYPYYGPYYGYHPAYPYAYYPGWAAYPAPVGPPSAGFVRLKVRPEDAEVWVGHRRVGIADDFDGYPGYLVLRPGVRLLTLRRPGYRDVKLRVEVAAGVQLDIRRRMAPLGSAEP